MGDAGAPSVRFATTRDGLRIAYTSFGSGPPLVFVRALNSHVEKWWGYLWIRRYFDALADCFTVYWFDGRGNGLSDSTENVDIDALVEDISAVVEDAGLDDIVVFGQGFGTPAAIEYSAREPDRVRRLILYCAHARALPITDVFVETMRVAPQQATVVMAHDSAPDAESIPTRNMRELNATREAAVAYFEFVRTVDVTASLRDVRAPTLVLHPERSPVVPRGLGREVAEGIPDARLVELPGGAYNVWAETVFDPTLRAIGEFTGMPISLMPHPRKLAVLLTDIVGSTEMTHRIGEERAREVFHTHDAIVKDTLDAHGGVEVKHTGDGTMATFESARDAVACAVDIQRRLLRRRESPGDELLVRMGIALGDVVEERGDLFGMTVMLAVRITNSSRANQILVSDSVFADTTGAFEFGDVSLEMLKGFPDPVPVREVLWNVQQ